MMTIEIGDVDTRTHMQRAVDEYVRRHPGASPDDVRSRLRDALRKRDGNEPPADHRTVAMVTALRYARDHRSAAPRSAFDYDEWARLVDAAIGPRDPAAKVPDTFDLEAARLAIEEG